MSAEAVSRISTYFRVCDGVRVRFAENRADSDTTVLLLAPWLESLWVFRRIWQGVAVVGRVVAIDLPGFGHSDGRPELIAPDASESQIPSRRPAPSPGRRGQPLLSCEPPCQSSPECHIDATKDPNFIYGCK
jgi:pimeloyl-ACP methyl ester carboxylesterase